MNLLGIDQRSEMVVGTYEAKIRDTRRLKLTNPPASNVQYGVVAPLFDETIARPSALPRLWIFQLSIRARLLELLVDLNPFASTGFGAKLLY